MKKLIIAVAGVLVVLGGVAVVVPSIIDWSKYKQPIIHMAEEATGYRISVDGPIRARILPFPAFELNKIGVQIEGADSSPVFRADRISASLALLPLLTGHVQVGTVHLDTPDVYVHVLENGYPDVPEILARKLGWADAKGPDVPATIPSDSNTSSAIASSITFSGVVIKKGHIVVQMDEGKQTHEVKDLDMDISLSDLMGPYKLDASGKYKDIDFDIDVHAGDMKDAAADVPLEAQIRLPNQGTRMSFDGTFSRRAGGDVQGTLNVESKRIVELAHDMVGVDLPIKSGPIELKTLLSATPRNVVMDRIELLYNKSHVTGVIKTRLKDAEFPRPSVYARLSSEDTVDLRSIFSSVKPSEKKVGTSSEAKKTGAEVAQAKIPEIPFDLDVEWKAGGLQFGPDPIKNVVLTMTADKGALRGRVQAGALPGSGSLDVTIYPGSNGWIMVQGDVHVDDPGKFMKDGLGMIPPDVLAQGRVRELKLKTGLQIASGGQVRANSGTATWRGGAISFAGSGYETRGAKRPLVTLALGGQSLDLDTLMPQQKTDQKKSVAPAPEEVKGAIKKSAATINLPFDVNASASFSAIKVNGYTLNGVEGSGEISGPQVQIERLKIGNVQGASVDASGTVADLRTMSGIDLDLAVLAQDGRVLTEKLAPEYASKWPKSGPLKLNLAYKGDLDKADVNVKGEAFGVGVALAGPVTDPLAKLSFDALQMTLTADQAGDAIRLVQPGFKTTAPLQGPMKISATTTIKDKFYGFKNLSGQFGTMSVKGEITADLTSVRPKISGGLNLGDVPLDALMGVNRGSSLVASTTASSGDAANAPISGGRWSNAPINTAWMRSFDADFTVAANRVSYNLWSMSDAGLNLNLNTGTMKISDIRAGLFGGKIGGYANIAAVKEGAPMDVAATIDMSDVNATSLTNALLNKNMNRVEGTVSMKIDVDARGSSPAQIISSLNGSASSAGQNVTINGIDVAKLVSWLATDLKPSTTVEGLIGSFMGSGSTVFENHTGAYTLTNGTVRLDQMVFDGEQAKLDTTGMADLPAWRVDTKTTLTIKQASNVPPLSFTLKGPLDRPTQNMLGGMFESYLQQQLGKQVNKLIEKKLGNKLNHLGLGGLLGAPVEPAPAPETPVDQGTAPEQEAPAPVPSSPPQTVKPEDVLIDVLKGLSR